jgi:hypothetical protein
VNASQWLSKTHKTLYLAAGLGLGAFSFSFAATPRRHHYNPTHQHKPVSTATADNKTTTTETPAPDPHFISHLESFTRSVEIQRKRDNGWKTAKANTELTTSDKVRTGRRSLARLKLGDGSKVLLLQNSQAEMETLSSV